MAIGAFFHGTGASQDQYQQVIDQLQLGAQPPTGLLYHAAGPTEDGFCVMEVWNSQEAFQRFFEEKLGAALEAANMSAMTAQPTIFPVVNTMQP